ncbi:MAG: nucleoside kinase [Planctomycetia bacterium]|nr:nucleoside kinase [Planctomycetia bacterium]
MAIFSSIHATQAFLLSGAFKKVFPNRLLVVEHSFGNAFFCHDVNFDPISVEELQKLENLMFDWIKSKTPITFELWPKQKFIEKLYKFNSHSKLAIARRWEGNQIPIAKYNKKYWDYMIEPLTSNKSQLRKFNLQKYNDGFLLRFATTLHPNIVVPFQDQPKLFATMEEHQKWSEILGISTIGDLNDAIDNDEIKELIWVAEGLHEKKISDIADEIVAGFPQKRIITIAGPSSAGKTTFSKRLKIQLRVNGYRSQTISTDDYFIDRQLLPIGDDGKRDFESIDGLDVGLLGDRLNALLDGKAIPERHFNFDLGTGKDTNNKLELGEWDFVIIEGIHGLNPKLTEKFGKGQVEKLYISAITQMNIDANHRISTSDNRLLRRLVRDNKFRGYSPEQTLERWTSVRLGEEKNIFPYSEEADLIFNSSLVYELPVLAKYARPLLKSVKGDDSVKQLAERLDLFLSFFANLDEKYVPGTSLLREYIGKSDFKY